MLIVFGLFSVAVCTPLGIKYWLLIRDLKKRRCEDCENLYRLDFMSTIGNYCPFMDIPRFTMSDVAEICPHYKRKWYKIWRPK